MTFTKGIALTVGGLILAAGATSALAQKRITVEPAIAEKAEPAIPVAPPAKKLKKLKILLMVSALRCRNSANDFRPAYQRFASRHLPTLRKAHMTMKAEYVAQHGRKLGQKQLDRAIVSMANEFGQGHPWLDCQGLAKVTTDLADSGGDHALWTAADTLLGQAPVAATGPVEEPVIATQTFEVGHAVIAPTVAAKH